MKKLLVLTILVATFFFGCQSEEDKDVYKTKGGDYASTKGKFIAKFPAKPNYSIIDNQIGLEKYQINYFNCSFGRFQIYTIQYVDFPGHFFKSFDTQEYYTQTVKSLERNFQGAFIISQEKSIEQNGLVGHEFVFTLNPDSPKSKGQKGYIEGRLFKVGNRVYTIQYIGKSNGKVEPFFNSFRLVKN